jgi:hypothetical protein
MMSCNANDVVTPTIGVRAHGTQRRDPSGHRVVEPRTFSLSERPSWRISNPRPTLSARDDGLMGLDPTNDVLQHSVIRSGSCSGTLPLKTPASPSTPGHALRFRRSRSTFGCSARGADVDLPRWTRALLFPSTVEGFLARMRWQTFLQDMCRLAEEIVFLHQATKNVILHLPGPMGINDPATVPDLD